METLSKQLHNQRNYKNANRTVLIAAVVAILFAVIGYPFLGPIALALFGLGLISFIPWRLSTYGRPANPRPLIIPYLVLIMLFNIHVGEEYLGHIWNDFSRIGSPMSEQTFFLVAATVAPIFWMSALVLLYLRTEIGNWMTWVFVTGMSLVELSHFIFPFMDTGHFGYFAGLYTCILPVIGGWVMVYLLFRDGRRSDVEIVSK